MAESPEEVTRRLLVVRHSERCDYHFRKKGILWYQKAFDKDGRYVRFDAQMPAEIAQRDPQDYKEDTPITSSGIELCIRAGELLRERGIVIDYAYSSPAYRCVQTAQGILKGSGLKEMPMRIEPGLFQWMRWCRHGLPTFMKPTEMNEAGFLVDLAYKPIDDPKCFDEDETLMNYYNRSFAAVKQIICKHPPGTILLVAHAGSLETLTRQLTGERPLEKDAFRAFLKGTSYLSINQAIESNHKWTTLGSPIPSLIHSGLDKQ